MEAVIGSNPLGQTAVTNNLGMIIVTHFDQTERRLHILCTRPPNIQLLIVTDSKRVTKFSILIYLNILNSAQFQMGRVSGLKRRGASRQDG